MNTLPLKLRKNGFNYTQVLRDGNKAIYAQSVTPKLTYFEVMIIKSRPEEVIKGKILPEREVFPGNEDFGYTAWTCMTLERAMEKYNLLEP
jgi:hypothetical protein